jgi:hypothetical protein
MLYRTYSLRRAGRVKSEDYIFYASFGETEFIMKDTLEYDGNTVVKMKYKDIRYFIETKTHYLLLPKSQFGWLWFGWVEWFNMFGLIDKAIIDESGKKDNLINFLTCRCEKINFSVRAY